MNIITARRGDKYGPEYSEALRAQIPGLVVLGEDRPFKTGLEGWWCKLEAFAPWNKDLRPALFVDLDTFIINSVDPILALDPARLWLIADFNRPDKRSESGLFIAPEGDVSSAVWSGYINAQNHYGDGGYLNTFPHGRITDEVDGILSYKKHELQDDPKGARIVCFHGKPKPHEAEGWAKDFWTTQISQWRKSAHY